jgi:hypothetical protein
MANWSVAGRLPSHKTKDNAQNREQTCINGAGFQLDSLRVQNLKSSTPQMTWPMFHGFELIIYSKGFLIRVYNPNSFHNTAIITQMKTASLESTVIVTVAMG